MIPNLNQKFAEENTLKKTVAAKIQLSDHEKKKLLEEIKAFYLDVRGVEIGIIEQQQIFDLFMDELAPIVYDRALDDAKRWYMQMQENMESDFYLLYKNT